MCDVGVGTGALSFVFHQTVEPKKAVYFGIDSNMQALRSAEVNALLQEVPMKTTHFDMRLFRKGHLEPSFAPKITKEPTFDVILSNPPWLVASPLEGFIDSGNYDPQEAFLQSLLSFVAHRLDRQRGVCFLIYSDLSQLLGVQSERRVETLAEDNGLSVHARHRFEGLVNMPKVASNFDALKQRAGVVIYELGF